jgi:hypothetical protein
VTSAFTNTVRCQTSTVVIIREQPAPRLARETNRRSKKVGPLRFTVSQRGISTSIGGGPLRITYGADGKVRRTIRARGTGFYDTKVIGGRTSSPRRRAPINTPPVTPSAGLRSLTLEELKKYSPSQNDLLRHLGLQLLWPTVVFGWLIYLLFTVGLWFLGVGAIVGIVIVAVKSTMNRQYTKALEAYNADQAKALQGAAPPKSTKVRCHRCKLVQTVPVSQSVFGCQECGANLKRKQPSLG